MTFTYGKNNCGFIEFTEPVNTVAPGQSAVLYRDTEVVGGGIIEADEGILSKLM